MERGTADVGVIVERRVLKNNRWADHVWMPVAVLQGAPAADPWTILSETPEVARYYAGSLPVEFFGSDTAMYRENLRSGRPSLWVSLRRTEAPPGVRVHVVTADPSEGEALTEAGTDIVEAVPMPPDLQQHLAAFVEAHHVERPFIKRQRDRSGPEEMSPRFVPVRHGGGAK